MLPGHKTPTTSQLCPWLPSVWILAREYHRRLLQYDTCYAYGWKHLRQNTYFCKMEWSGNMTSEKLSAILQQCYPIRGWLLLFFLLGGKWWIKLITPRSLTLVRYEKLRTEKLWNDYRSKQNLNRCPIHGSKELKHHMWVIKCSLNYFLFVCWICRMSRTNFSHRQ